MKIQVLVVDDEEQFVQQLGERLRLRDFDVSTALSGEQAVQKIQDDNFDVVILDVVMPGINGIETLREMKQIKPLTEVIMLSGYATAESAIEGMKLGAFDYLLKPTNTEDLIMKVNTAYARKANHEERIRQAKMNEIFSPFSEQVEKR
jgi:DNA-binding NtrC family response regulator